MSKKQVKPSAEMTSFGIWLTSYLSKHKTSVAGFGRLTGLSPENIFGWIHRDYFPNGGSIIVVAEVIARMETCFIDTIIMEIVATHPNYINAIRRENRRQEISDNAEGIDAGVV